MLQSFWKKSKTEFCQDKTKVKVIVKVIVIVIFKL